MFLTYDTGLTDRARIHWRAVGRIAAVATLSISLLVPHLGAQGSPRRPQVHADSARHVADLFFRAVADERWDVAARFTDTTVIQRMVREQFRWRRNNPTPPEMTLEDFMRDDPNKPRVVAEYELKRYRERTARVETNPVTSMFARVKSVDDLAALSAREATARFLEAQDQRVIMRELARAGGCPDSLFRGPVTMHRIYGAVLANDSIAFVLHGEGPLTDGPMPGIGPMVMELRLRNAGWLIRPDYALLRHANSVVSGVSCDSTRRRPPG